MRVTKLEGAQRQIQHAIKLYFDYGDDVVIHALIGGAHEVLQNIGATKDIKSVKDEVAAMFPEENPRDIFKGINEFKNFLKHAARDPNPHATMDFDESTNELWILDACMLYEKISGKIDPLMRIFNVWMAGNDPNYLKDKTQQVLAKKIGSYTKDRRKFLLEGMEAIRQSQADSFQ